MSRGRRSAWAGAATCALVAGALVACTSPDGDVAPTTPAPTAAPSPVETSAAATPTPPAPSTDAPVPDEPAPGAGAPATAHVVVVSSGWEPATSSVEVSGLVSVLEEGGTCTLTLQLGARSAAASAAAEPAASTTSCPVLSVPRDQLSAGVWTATLTYESPTTSATSSPFEIEVPA